MKHISRKRALAVPALAASLALFLSACGGGDAAKKDENAAGGDAELQKITVGVMPIVDTAPIYLGQQEGFFEEEGLELDLQSGQGGAAIVPGVVSGNFQIGFSNLVSIMVANDKGMDLKFVANGASTTGNKDKDFSAVIIKEDSDIKSAKDLEGKRVSVNTLANIGDTTVSQLVEEAGGDPKKVDFTEVGFPDAPAALDTGQVDAIWVLEPFLTAAMKDGGRVMSYNYADFDAGLDIAGYFTSAEMMEKDPEMVQKFTRAMNKSLDFAEENPEKVREIVGTYTKIDEETRAEMVLPKFTSQFNKDADQKLADAAKKYGTLNNDLDVSTVLP